MNYSEALEYIHSVNWCFCKPGLERIGELCRMLGEPQRELKFIHVAGTNGKGSFCSMLSSILKEAGYKTGLFTSPYIRFFNERMQINGEPISDSELAEITSYVRPFADQMTDKPTEFELITAICFEYFKRNGCDVVVLEAGMGGRLDSTNIIDASLLSVITGVSLDHTAFLGDTVEKIAAEKAGIIKSGCPVLLGGDSDEALCVVRKRAEARGAPLCLVDYSSLLIRSAT
ncbi:MAG: bifunctional folylpolyglutamate synthase/dihydrofolate synthase, partial [Clostridia bacterium]|nr:bifunctional folylpolyglutamate synthase/dihydrofolate synthase [Clostridia bacterium]